MLEASIVIAALLSAIVLALMLAAPILPSQPTPMAVAATRSASPSASAEAGAELPVGLFRARGPAFGGPCLGIELSADSYPPDRDGSGTARIVWWERAVVDGANPAACDSRVGELHESSATVTAVPDDDEPDALIGYNLAFRVSLAGTDVQQRAEIVILFERSTSEQLQAVVVSPAGMPGLVLDRVASIEPPLASAPPSGSP